MQFNTKLRTFISDHFNFFLKLLIYGYISFMIIALLPLHGYFSYIDWSTWEDFTNFSGDIYHYEQMAYGNYDIVMAPYKYRPLIPFLWSLFLPFIPLIYSVLIWNFLFLLGSDLLADRYLNSFNFSQIYKIFGVIVINVSYPIISVAFTPNIDIAMLFFTLLFMVGIVENNPYLIGLSSILGVITKESILFLFPVYFIYNYKEIKESLLKLWKQKIIPKKQIILSILFIFIAFCEFILIRNFTFSINNDFDLFKLEFPTKYLSRWVGFNWLSLIKYFLWTLTIVWLAPLGYIIHKWKLDKWFCLALYGIIILFIISMVSLHIIRTGFFIIPLYLPTFIRFTKDFENFKNNKHIS